MVFLYFTDPKVVEMIHRRVVGTVSVDSAFTNRKIREQVSKQMKTCDFVQLRDGNYAGYVQEKISFEAADVFGLCLIYNSDKTYLMYKDGSLSTGKLLADEVKAKYPIFFDYMKNCKKVAKMPECFIMPTRNLIVFDSMDITKVREQLLLVNGRQEVIGERVDKCVFFVYTDLYGYKMETDIPVTFTVVISIVAQTFVIDKLGIKLPLFLLREYPAIAQRNVRKIVNLFNSMTVNGIIEEFLSA